MKVSKKSPPYLFGDSSDAPIAGTTMCLICLIFDPVLLNMLKAIEDNVYVMNRTNMSGKAKQPKTISNPPSKQQPIVNNVPKKIAKQKPYFRNFTWR